MSAKRTAQQAFKLFCTPFLTSKVQAIPKNATSIRFNMRMPGGNHEYLAIQGYQWNHSGKKKALILHGFNSSALKFERFAALLVDKGYEVFAFDAPAHGSSEGKTINALEYSELIKQVLVEFGPVQSFIAHSFGGIALCLALEETKTDEDTRIVFIAPATETVSAVDSAFEMLRISNPAIRREFDKIIFDLKGKETAWYSIRRAIKNIPARVLWIHDEDDDITPISDALKVKEDNHPNIEFFITKGLGHRRIYHDSLVKQRVCAFL